MYQSRLRNQQVVSIAVDASSGELLEFVRENTADNVLKSCTPYMVALDGLLLTEQGNICFHPKIH